MPSKRSWFRSSTGALSAWILLLIGLIVGMAVLGGAHTALKATETTEFCISCHELRDTVYVEYQATPHYSNASGVQAGCADCHVPKPFVPMVVDHYRALGELWSSWQGTIDTPEKFEEHRLRMAEAVWAEMEASDSRECRDCHNEHAMNFELQTQEASTRMQEGFANGDTCIDCHKGIAHKLPDMSQGYKKAYEDLLAEATEQGAAADSLYLIETEPYFATEEAAKAGEDEIGQVLAASHLTVLDRSGDLLKVRIEGWQQDGNERVIYEMRGQRIFTATVKKDATEAIERHASETDPDTDLLWHQVSLEGWMAKTALIDSLDDLWSYGAQLYNASCATCHSLPAADHYLANQWIGTLKSMERFITLDKEQYRFLQKYLQMHASDTGGAEAGH